MQFGDAYFRIGVQVVKWLLFGQLSVLAKQRMLAVMLVIFVLLTTKF